MRLSMQQLGKLSGSARNQRKYGNVPGRQGQYWFDSQLEMRRYGELKLLWSAGQIQALEVHPRFALEVNGTRIGYYEADFGYFENGHLVIEDCKGVLTPLYRWKKAHLKAQYGYEIREIRKA